MFKKSWYHDLIYFITGRPVIVNMTEFTFIKEAKKRIRFCASTSVVYVYHNDTRKDNFFVSSPDGYFFNSVDLYNLYYPAMPYRPTFHLVQHHSQDNSGDIAKGYTFMEALNQLTHIKNLWLLSGRIVYRSSLTELVLLQSSGGKITFIIDRDL